MKTLAGKDHATLSPPASLEEPLSSFQIPEVKDNPKGFRLQASSLLGGRKIRHFPEERKTLGKRNDHKEARGIFCPNLIFKHKRWLKVVKRFIYFFFFFFVKEIVTE